MKLPAEGGCLCEALRYRVTAAPTDAAYCRRGSGAPDDPEAVRPVKHIRTKSRLSWFDVDDGLPRHAEYPPEDKD